MFKTCSFLLAVASLVLQSQAASFYAGQIVNYDPGTGYATEFSTGLGYVVPTAALGQPQRDTPFGAVTPFNPPYSRNDLVSLGVNGTLTVSFDSPIFNDAANLFGLDFIIYGSAGFIDANYPNGQTDGGASMFGQNPGITRVSVSTGDGIFYTLNPLYAPVVDGLYPTDGAGIFGLPVNSSLRQRDFANKSMAEIRTLYAGSAGGTGYDLSHAIDANGNSVNLSSVSMVRVDVLSGRAEIDAFAVVPEPAAWAIGGLGLVLVWAARRRSRH
ncbi:MAG: hypothetical protein SGJ20_05975 [Planctomycetota bacterium]|nr:hypothetical protein [Planctomycetota bacterium]